MNKRFKWTILGKPQRFSYMDIPTKFSNPSKDEWIAKILYPSNDKPCAPIKARDTSSGK